MSIYLEYHKNWWVELRVEGKTLAELKIPGRIFQEDTLSPLLFVIMMMPRNHIRSKCVGGYKFTKSLEKINQLMYMDDIKVFAENEKTKIKTLMRIVRIYSQDIGMEFGIGKYEIINHIINECSKLAQR